MNMSFSTGARIGRVAARLIFAGFVPSPSLIHPYWKKIWIDLISLSFPNPFIDILQIPVMGGVVIVKLSTLIRI
jgi:hypothetical protein